MTILALAGSLSKNSRGSDYIAGLVKLVISLPQSRDDPITSALGQAECDEQHLIELVMDDTLELCFQLHAFCPVQVALENRKLQVIAIVLADAKYPPQPFGVGDIITYNVGVAHGWR
jgi:hypothetical protein